MSALISANTIFRLRTAIDRSRRVMGLGGKGVQMESSCIISVRNTRFPFPTTANGHLHRELGSGVIDKNAVVMAAVRLKPTPR